MNKWYEVWNKRCGVTDVDLFGLIKLDGYDTGAGQMSVENWRECIQNTVDKLQLFDDASVYEVGCGAGAFLYGLRELKKIKVGGNDYAEGLIAMVRKIFPDGDFQRIGANEIDTSVTYDFVISSGVFHYFPDYEYAEAVVGKMIKKAGIAAAILAVPDMETREEAERLRREHLTPEEYEKKYAGLEHMYFDRQWFVDVAEKHGYTCEVFDGLMPNYIQNKFHFGCVIRK